MRFFPRLVLLLASMTLAPCPALAAASEYEPSFGVGGVVQLDFSPEVPPLTNDYGLAVCPGPSGTLFTLSHSDQRQFVGAWLDPSGKLDADFGVGGLRSFATESRINTPAASCTASGRVAVAWVGSGVSEENTVFLALVDPSTGLPAPAYGNAGITSVDLDQYASGLGDAAEALNFAAGSNGDLLVFGRYRFEPGFATAGFAVRVSASGVVSAVLLSHLVAPDILQLVGGGPASDGTVWVAADTSGVNGRRAARVRLDPVTLALIDRPQAQLATDVEPQTARMLTPDRLAIAGDALLGGGAFVVLAGTSRSDFESFDTNAQHEFSSLVPLPDQRLLMASTRRAAGISHNHFAQLRYGAGLALDTAFGSGGLWLAPIGRAPGCEDEALRLVRATYAHGSAAAVGFVNNDCTGGFDIDAQVLRLRAPSLFRDGFETD